MRRLGTETLSLPDNGVARPGFDRAALTPGIVHIGTGAFHRAHQAVHTDAALAAAFGPWGIVGASLRSAVISEEMRAQDCLYSVVTRDASGDSARIVGSILDVLPAVTERERRKTIKTQTQKQKKKQKLNKK